MKRAGRELAGVWAASATVAMLGTAVSTPSMSSTLLISMTPTPALTQFWSRVTPGTWSRMMLGSVRGAAGTTSLTITPSTGCIIGSMVSLAGSRIQTL